MAAVKAESPSAKINRTARQQLDGHWRKAAAAGLLLISLELLAGMVSSRFTLNGSDSAYYMGFLVALILELFLGVVADGALLHFLKLARGTEPAPEDFLVPFRIQPDRYFIIGLIKLGGELLIYAPVVAGLFMVSDNPRPWLIIMGIWSIIGTALCILFRISIALAPFFLLEKEDTGAIEALKQSLKLMYGRKKRLLACVLPFIGYGILALCSLGIALIWIIPYYLMVLAEFYRDTIGELQ